MSAKNLMFMLTLGVVAVTLSGCDKCSGGKTVEPLIEPGGPIIVVEPVPDPAGPAADIGLAGYHTAWHLGCPVPGGLPGEAIKSTTHGIPGRFSARDGAEAILVTLRDSTLGSYPFTLTEHAFEAKTVVMGLKGAPSVTFDFPSKPGKPAWKRGAAIYRYESMDVHDWSEELYGQIEKFTISDRYGHDNIDVQVGDVKWIKISYMKPKGSAECK